MFHWFLPAKKILAEISSDILFEGGIGLTLVILKKRNSEKIFSFLWRMCALLN